jgi:hypothetical protein
VPVPSAAGEYAIEYFSVDAVGNVEATRTSPFVVASDLVPPMTTCDAKASYAPPARISLTATDTGFGVLSTHWLLDGVAGNGLAIEVPTYGAHTLTYWSVDCADNVESRKTASFFVRDERAPAVTSDAGDAYVDSAFIQFAATDEHGGSGVSSISTRLDGSATQTVAGTMRAIAVSEPGAHRIVFWATDKAGNSTAAQEVTFRIVGPTRFVLDRLPAALAPGATTTVRGRIDTSSATAQVLGQPVQLQVLQGSAWAQAAPSPVITGQDGAFTFEISPFESAIYRVATAPGTALRFGQSNGFVIGVRASVGRPSAPRTPRAKRKFSIAGRVTRPLRRSARLEWYRVKGSSKKRYSVKTVSLTSSGR